MEAVLEHAPAPGRDQPVDHADHAAGRIAPYVDVLADRAPPREQPRRQRAAQKHGGHLRRLARYVQGVLALVLVRVEAAALDHAQAQGRQQAAIVHVVGGGEDGVGLARAQVDARCPDIVAVGQLVDAGDRADPGHGGQGGGVLAPHRIAVAVRLQAADAEVDQLVLDDAAVAAHLPGAVADHEDRVADDRAAQCDLQHDQRRGGLVPHQDREDGTDFHGSCSPYWLLSCSAGGTCIARHAGNRPASRLAPSARATVSSNVAVSICASRA